MSDPDLVEFVNRADELRLKIELAEILPVQGSIPPTLRRWSFDAGPEYWYPASTIKTCAVIAAFQELAELGVSRDAWLAFQPLFEGESPRSVDESNVEGGHITAAHLARKILLVSDNEAFNRLYEVAGHEDLNRRMWDLGLHGIRLHHRLSIARSLEDNRRSPEVVIAGGAGLVQTIPERRSTLDVPLNDHLTGTSIGVAHIVNGERVEGPMDFTAKNYARLRDLQDLHVLLLAPEVSLDGRFLDLPDTARGGLVVSLRHDAPGDDDRSFVFEAMRQRPRDSANPVYDPEHYSDDYSKFVLQGVQRVGGDDVQVLDKVGRAYGFSTTNSYVYDPSTGQAFFLAATLYTNPNGVLNDGVYDYDTADRFFIELGEAVARALWTDESP